MNHASSWTSTLETQKTAAAIRLSDTSQNTEDRIYPTTAIIRPLETCPISHLFHIVRVRMDVLSYAVSHDRTIIAATRGNRSCAFSCTCEEAPGEAVTTLLSQQLNFQTILQSNKWEFSTLAAKDFLAIRCNIFV